MSSIDSLLEGIEIPKMMRVRQSFPRPRIENIEEELIGKLRQAEVCSLIQENQTVAVGVGSRGGATAQGQREILIRMGIQQEYVEAPIHATMETVHIGTTESRLPVRIDKYACEADAIVIV